MANFVLSSIFILFPGDILKHIAIFKPTENADVVLQACDHLYGIFKNNPEQASHLITHHAVIPVTEMIEVRAL